MAICNLNTYQIEYAYYSKQRGKMNMGAYIVPKRNRISWVLNRWAKANNKSIQITLIDGDFRIRIYPDDEANRNELEAQLQEICNKLGVTFLWVSDTLL